MSESVDYYELLNIQPGATTREITTAYKVMAKKLHPDKNPNDPKAGIICHLFYVGEKFDQIAKAYKVLIDPTLRSEVDQKMKVKLARKEEDKVRTDAQRKMKEDLSRKETQGIIDYFYIYSISRKEILFYSKRNSATQITTD